jgi:hypothetical protein
MTVHVTTTSRGSGTVVTLQGVADDDLVAMLADGIKGILAVDPKLFVDTSALTQPRTPAGRTLLDQLLGDRDMAGSAVRGVEVAAFDEGRTPT